MWFSGWRQWVRVKSLCWATQRRRNSHLWTSVWMTRPWMQAWSVTARRQTTTPSCVTPLRQCNVTLRRRRIWLCFVLSSLDWFVAGENTQHPLSCLTRTLRNEPRIISTVTASSSSFLGCVTKRKPVDCLVPVFEMQAEANAAALFHANCDLSNSWKQAQVFLSSTVKTNDNNFSTDLCTLQPLMMKNSMQKTEGFSGYNKTLVSQIYS